MPTKAKRTENGEKSWCVFSLPLSSGVEEGEMMGRLVWGLKRLGRNGSKSGQWWKDVSCMEELKGMRDCALCHSRALGEDAALSGYVWWRGRWGWRNWVWLRLHMSCLFESSPISSGISIVQSVILQYFLQSFISYCSTSSSLFCFCDTLQ